MTTEELLQLSRERRADAGSRIDSDTRAIPPLYAVATPEQVLHAERRMKLELPVLLKRTYTEVGNGGFGPGSGLLGLDSGYMNSEGQCLPERYERLLDEGWPAGLLPLWDWGDAGWSCVNIHTPAATIVTMDELGQTTTRFSLASWLETWASGGDLFNEIYELGVATIMNPFTRQPMEIKRRARAKGVVS